MLADTLLGIVLTLITTLPLAWKWQLGVRRTAAFVGGLGLLVGLAVALLGPIVALARPFAPLLIWLVTVAAAFVFLAYRFYRDPERSAPGREDVIVSPADGEVIYVRDSRGGRLPVATKHGLDCALQELTKTPLQCEDAAVIGISMSFLDVHVNRAPIAGRVTLQRHFPGRFGSLRRADMVFENERTTTIIEQGALQVAVVQIASRLVRQIVSFVSEGQAVALGQRIGMIRLGSQVDIVLPARPDVRVTVQPGERVWAGMSILAVLDSIAVHMAETAHTTAYASDEQQR
jgi:phosphatidylserine decarboxylase